MTISSAAPADTSGMLPEPFTAYAGRETRGKPALAASFSHPALGLPAYLPNFVELLAVGVSAMTSQVGHAFGIFADLAAVLVFVDQAGTAGVRALLRL
jgi:hypothetical protein